MPSKPPFHQLVTDHYREIFHYLYRMLGQTQAAEDALQDAFLRAFRAYDQLADDTNTRAWLYRIAGNVARTQLKRNHRSQDGHRLHENLADRAAPVAQQIETHEQLRELRQAVQKLPHMQQAALIMRKYQGLSYKEIGAALDCSAESARANVYQALKKLRRTFSQEVHNAR
jgi:RNA polymerase sigma-70 factor (ECF subfamily)